MDGTNTETGRDLWHVFIFGVEFVVRHTRSLSPDELMSHHNPPSSRVLQIIAVLRSCSVGSKS